MSSRRVTQEPVSSRPELQETVSSLLEEKKILSCQLQDQQRQIEELTALVSIHYQAWQSIPLTGGLSQTSTELVSVWLWWDFEGGWEDLHSIIWAWMQNISVQIVLSFFQCIRKVFRPLDVLNILLCHSLILKWIQVFFPHLTIPHNDITIPHNGITIPHNDKAKTGS